MKYLSSDPFSVGSTHDYRVNWERIFSPKEGGRLQRRREIAQALVKPRKGVRATTQSVT
jgi:hypothetical protein